MTASLPCACMISQARIPSVDKDNEPGKHSGRGKDEPKNPTEQPRSKWEAGSLNHYKYGANMPANVFFFN